MMAESKKRARKSKIEVREFVDEIPNSVLQIPDEEEDLVHNEVQEPTYSPVPAPVPTPAILRKILPPEIEQSQTPLDHDYTSITRPPATLQSAPMVSVRVEVEQIDEERLRGQKRTINSFQIEFDTMYKITDLIRTHSSNMADKYLSVELKNIWGRALRHKNQVDLHELMIQSALHSWSYTVCDKNKEGKESPLFYQCHVCYKSWWFLQPFREHIHIHNATKLKIYYLENLSESFIIANYHLSLTPMYISCDGDCYRCGNPYSFHVKPNKQLYICKYCELESPNCTATSIHQLSCERRTHNSYAIVCDICSARHNSSKGLNDHLRKFHMVRSDVVVPYVLRTCGHCQQPYSLYSMHMCTKYTHNCQYCYRQFATSTLLKLHVDMGKSCHCKICNLLLDKSCMETQHMLTHTENFRMVYKCRRTVGCSPTNLYEDESSVRYHYMKEHTKKLNSKLIVHEKILVPRQCMEESFDDKNIRFRDYNKSNNSSVEEVEEMEDWCLEDDGHGRAYQVSDHVIVKEELLEMEPRVSTSESDDDCEMGYAEMLSKVFNINTGEPRKKSKKTAKVQKRPSNSKQPTKVIEPNVKTELNATKNQTDNNSKPDTNTLVRILPKPTVTTEPKNPEYRQYENPTRKNLPKIWQVQSMAAMEPATSKEIIQSATSQTQPSTVKIQPSTSQIQFNTSQKPITIISKIRRNEKSTESEATYTLVEQQTQQIDQPKIKTEPIDIDEMDMDYDPITIKEEPIEACLGSSVSAAYFGTENDNDQTLKDQNDSGQRDQSGSRSWSNANSDSQPELENIRIKYETCDDESQGNIDINDEFSVNNLLAVKMEPEDVKNELRNSDDFDMNDDINDSGDEQHRPWIKRISASEDRNMKLKKVVNTDKTILKVVEKVVGKGKTRISRTADSSPETDKPKKSKKEKDKKHDSDDGEKETGSKKSKKYITHALYDDDGTRMRKIYTCHRCGYTQYHRLFRLHKGSNCDFSPFGMTLARTINQSDSDKESKTTYTSRNKTQSYSYHKSKTTYTCRNKKQNYSCCETKRSHYDCTKCNKKYDKLSRYLSHFTTHGYRAFECPVCDDSFENVNNLVPHFQKHVKKSYVRCWLITDLNSDEPPKRNHKCLTCRNMVEVAEFIQHYEGHLKLKPKNSNLASARRKAKVTETQNSTEVEEDNLVIDEKDTESLLKTTVEIDSAVMDKANRSTENQNKRLSPAILTASIKQLKGDINSRICRICTRDFDRRHDVKRHIVEHLLRDAYSKKDSLPTNSLRCQICHEDFTKAEDYKFHMREHGGLPVYRCELCNKTFSDSSNFAKHKKIHNMGALTCDICGKKFHKKSALETHIIMHMTTDPIYCKPCKKKFFCQSHYSKHMRLVHKRYSSHPYKCPQCDAPHQSLKEKWDHAWEVHGDRKYKADCPRCHLKFRKYSLVKRHAKEEHGIELYVEKNTNEIRVKSSRRVVTKKVDGRTVHVYIHHTDEDE